MIETLLEEFVKETDKDIYNLEQGLDLLKEDSDEYYLNLEYKDL